jgi:hypothetical protein
VIVINETMGLWSCSIFYLRFKNHRRKSFITSTQDAKNKNEIENGQKNGFAFFQVKPFKYFFTIITFGMDATIESLIR